VETSTATAPVTKTCALVLSLYLLAADTQK